MMILMYLPTITFEIRCFLQVNETKTWYHLQLLITKLDKIITHKFKTFSHYYK